MARAILDQLPNEPVVYLGDSASTVVECDFVAAGGSGQIAPAAMADLSAGLGTFSGYVVESDVVLAGDYDLLITVAQVTRQSDGDWANGSVTIE